MAQLGEAGTDTAAPEPAGIGQRQRRGPLGDQGGQGQLQPLPLDLVTRWGDRRGIYARLPYEGLDRV